MKTRSSTERPLPATGIPTRAKLKAAYVSASLPQPGGDVEQPISSCANMTSSTKLETSQYNDILAAPPLDPSLYLALRARRWLRIAK